MAVCSYIFRKNSQWICKESHLSVYIFIYKPCVSFYFQLCVHFDFLSIFCVHCCIRYIPCLHLKCVLCIKEYQFYFFCDKHTRSLCERNGPIHAEIECLNLSYYRTTWKTLTRALKVWSLYNQKKIWKSVVFVNDR